MGNESDRRARLDHIPAEIAAVSDYERLATQFMDPAAYEFVSGGSGDEQSLRANRAAFEAFSIYNRVLVDCTQGTAAVTLLGRRFRHPILLAPVAHHALAHPDAECATARGAAATDAGMIVSTYATRSLEDVAAVSGVPKWFQLYFQTRRDETLSLVRRAEAAGYEAIVVTVDTAVQPMSRRAVRSGFRPFAGPFANLAGHAPKAQIALDAAESVVFQGMMREAPQWADLEWLIGEATLPVIVKGVSHPDDAARCIESGAAGVIASNHGGRALDGAPAALAALPALRARLGNEALVLLDGGVRCGADVFKAIALGANAVLVGRPQIFALAVAGPLGVAHMLKMMRDEFELCMALAGRPTVDCITPSAIFRA